MKSDVSTIDNVIAKSLIFEFKGDFMKQHVHKFDHMHLVAYGSIRVQVDGEDDTIHHAGEMINLKANIAHKIISETEDAVSYCIHALKPAKAGSGFEFESVVVDD